MEHLCPTCDATYLVSEGLGHSEIRESLQTRELPQAPEEMSPLEQHVRTLIRHSGLQLIKLFPYGMKLIYEDLGIPVPDMSDGVTRR